MAPGPPIVLTEPGVTSVLGALIDENRLGRPWTLRPEFPKK
jgi:hypothetical protein